MSDHGSMGSSFPDFVSSSDKEGRPTERETAMSDVESDLSFPSESELHMNTAPNLTEFYLRARARAEAKDRREEALRKEAEAIEAARKTHAEAIEAARKKAENKAAKNQRKREARAKAKAKAEAMDKPK